MRKGLSVAAPTRTRWPTLSRAVGWRQGTRGKKGGRDGRRALNPPRHRRERNLSVVLSSAAVPVDPAGGGLVSWVVPGHRRHLRFSMDSTIHARAPHPCESLDRQGFTVLPRGEVAIRQRTPVPCR